MWGCRGTAKYGGGDADGGRARAGGSSGPVSATKFAQHGPSPTQPVTEFAQQPQKRHIWGVSSAQGELFHAHTHDQAVLGELFRAPDARRATLKPTTPLQSLIRASMKPTPPLRAPEQQPLKPTTPLQPKNAPKTPVSHPQRRRRFQPQARTSAQRRRWFQPHASTHKHRQTGFTRRICDTSRYLCAGSSEESHVIRSDRPHNNTQKR